MELSNHHGYVVTRLLLDQSILFPMAVIPTKDFCTYVLGKGRIMIQGCLDTSAVFIQLGAEMEAFLSCNELM
jgi:hypothetical protein